MGAKVVLVTGPAGSGKTQRLLAEYRAALADGPVGCALWLAPARRNIEQLRQALLGPGLGACFSPHCYTFGQFAIQLLSAASTPLRALNRLGQREILRAVTLDAQHSGQLEHFGPIVGTPGFLDLLASFVRELKRHEIWPEELAEQVQGRVGRRRPEPKLLELAGLYARYQDVLDQRSLFDPEGRFWAARALLRAGQTRPFERLRKVFVDGFTDFTRTEHEILEILAQRVERVVISLPLEGEPRRRELFAKTIKTEAELHRRHKIETIALDRAGADQFGQPNWPALAYFERNLFRSPAEGPPGPAPALDGVELIVAASARAEIESIAARIKRLLITGDHRPANDRPGGAVDRAAGDVNSVAGVNGVPDVNGVAGTAVSRSGADKAGGDGPEIAAPSEQNGTVPFCQPSAPARRRDILVVFRSLDSAEELVREVFHEYGIPLAMESARPLARCGVLSAVTALVRLEFEDWTQRELFAALASSYLRPSWTEAGGADVDGTDVAGTDVAGADVGGAEAIQAAVALARRLRVSRGRQDLLSQAARRANRLERRTGADARDAENTTSEEHAALDRERRQTRLGLRFLEQLAAVTRALPQQASAAGWADAIEQLADQTGVARRDAAPVAPAASRETDRGDPVDALAWNAALTALRGAERLNGWLNQPARQLDRAQFLSLWQDLLRIEPLPEGSDETGRVRVLSAPAARGLSADYVFLAGLGEQSFPLAGGARSLLSDTDVAALVAAGLPLPARADRGRDEMLLFYEAITRPKRGLFLSYAALDAKAQPLMPSPYLYELAEMCGERWPKRRGSLHLSPLPEYSEPMCMRDLRLMAVAGAGQGGSPGVARGANNRDVSLLAELLRQQEAQTSPAAKPASRGVKAGQRPGVARSGLANNISQGLLAHEERRRAGFGAFEGLLLSDAARASLAARYGPQSLWSASQLEQYVSCPFEFFLRRILRIEPLEDMELAVDYQHRGLVLHGVLAGLHRRVNERAGGPAPLGNADATLADAEELLQELCSPRADETPLAIALREIDRRLLATAIERYVGQHAKYAANMARSADDLRPAHFEVAFGASATERAAAEPIETDETDDADLADPLSTSAPFRFDCGAETVLLRGRIDRIDIASVGDSLVFNVLDYKSGKSGRHGKTAVEEGLALQLPLYAMAAAELLLADKKASPLEAGYWFLKGTGYAPALKCHDASGGQVQAADGWLAYREQLARWVLGAVRGVRAGYFPVTSRDDECTSRCPYSTVCRINQVRSLDKVWTPPETPPSAKPQEPRS